MTPHPRYWFELDIEAPAKPAARLEPEATPQTKSEKPSIGPVPDYVPAFLVKDLLDRGWRP